MAGQKVSFVFSFLVLLKEMRMQGQSNPFPCFHSFRKLPPSQKLWKKSSKSTPTRTLRVWTSVTLPKTRHQTQHSLKTTGYIHHIKHTRSPFLQTIQLQTKTTQLQNHNSKVHQSNNHDLTTHKNHSIHCHNET